MNLLAVPFKILGVILIFVLALVAIFFLAMALLHTSRRNKDADEEDQDYVHITPEDAERQEEIKNTNRDPASEHSEADSPK